MSGRAPLVWCAGVAWDEPVGTDRRIVEAIARTREVHWIDPPRFTARPHGATDTEVAGVVRHRVWAPPATTREPVIAVTQWLRSRAVERVVRDGGADAVVVANPLARFPRATAARRVLYVTDDWEAGAGLMGMSAARIARTMRVNRDDADRIAVVSPVLAVSRTDAVLPNGGPEPFVPATGDRVAAAVLVGQLNERLDIEVLEAVVAAGVAVRVVGRRTDHEEQFGRRLSAWLQHPLVDWHGAVPASDVPGLIADAAVGLVPYADTDFNRASSPLKTFDYLAAGLPVASTDLPASRWMRTPHVRIAPDARSFAAAVRTAVAQPADAAAEAERREVAHAHTWERRAEAFLALVAEPDAVAIGGAR